MKGQELPFFFFDARVLFSVIEQVTVLWQFRLKNRALNKPWQRTVAEYLWSGGFPSSSLCPWAVSYGRFAAVSCCRGMKDAHMLSSIRLMSRRCVQFFCFSFFFFRNNATALQLWPPLFWQRIHSQNSFCYRGPLLSVELFVFPE